ncbi:MAG: MarR family transcriptional regulator [Leptospiraceae bacterium]|nr:MarR family transcriptional regulator [Leptospiraceae bacterium]
MKNSNVFSNHSEALNSTGFLFWRISNEWQRRINASLQSLSLTHTQFVLLANIEYLNKKENPVTQADLGSHSGTDPMTISSVVRSLEKKKYVLRKSHPEDTRKKTLILTKEGRSILKKSISIVESTDHEFFSNFQSTDQNNSLQKLLRKGFDSIFNNR